MQNKSKILSILSSKGGVGKSCLTNLLANEISYLLNIDGDEPRKKVLVVDLDAQHTIAAKRRADVYALQVNVSSSDHGELSDEQKMKNRLLSNRYKVLLNQQNYMAYDLWSINTSSEASIEAGMDEITSKKYEYILLDFPGTLEQEGTADFFMLIEHLFIPLTSNQSDVLGHKSFMEQLESFSQTPPLLSLHFFFNKYDVIKKRICDAIQQNIEEEFDIKFLKTRIKNSPSLDMNTILPATLKINLGTGEIQDTIPCIREFAQEIIAICQTE